MTQCPRCKLPRFYGPSGYAGPACMCVYHYVGGEAPLDPRHWNEEHMKRIAKIAEELGRKIRQKEG